jgi:hypothetical protein
MHGPESDSDIGYPATPGRRKLGITEFKEKWGWGEARAEVVLTWQMMWGGDGSS